jgi:1-acyl-sn-glycerol-3-phosphate acyltransferase
MGSDRLTGGADLPGRWVWLFRLFRWYSRRYVRKHVHAVRLSKSGRAFPPNPPGTEPLLIVLNHPAWWDPMICMILSRVIADRDQFAAIDAGALEQYPAFRKMGFIPVDTGTLRGAAEFVRTGTTILSRPGRAYWVTAQGRFTDARERPLAISAGVGHLASRLSSGVVVPLAIEYAFWTERTPEALVRIGEPLLVAEHPGRSGKEWAALIEAAMTANLDSLNSETVARDPARFTSLLEGKVGVGGPYDWWRRLWAWVRGKKFEPAHGGGGERA